ncbi:MAG: tRNA dimethylallyltransferase, partial [Gemmatimonadota bacterium]|nr:tRNA dimethylallyltransferase [Gemmatimonadota bacterium]
VRTCMIALLTGYRLSDWHARGNEPSPLRGLVVVVGIPTDVLDRRIDERVSSMEREGLVEEVRALLDAGYRSTHPGMSGVGYREVADHVGGRATLEEALERTRLATRQYARRQRTWFRRQLPPGSIEVDGTRPIMELARGIAAEWERRGGLAGHRPDTRGGSGRRSGERALTG